MNGERWVSYNQLVYYIMTKKRLAGITMSLTLLDQEVAKYERREKPKNEDEVVFGLYHDDQKEIEYCLRVN